MSVKTKGLLGDINKANVLHSPVQVKNLNFNSYIYIFILSIKYAKQSNTQVHLLFKVIKWFYFAKGVLELPPSETLEHNSLLIC